MNPSAFLAIALLSAVSMLSACDRTPSGSDGAAIRLNAPILTGFKADAIIELSLTQNDPVTQANWSARLTRHNRGSAEKAEWVIASAPQGVELKDSWADSAFVNHLLSLMMTFQGVSEAPQGPPVSFGLETPRFGIRATAPDKTVSIHFGFDAPRGAGSYTFLPGPPPSRIVVGSGSLLQMLGMIQSFDVLRRRTLPLITADDVDEIELWTRGRKIFYSQRQGDEWADARQKTLRAPLQNSVAETLEALTHLRIQAFIDDPETARNPQRYLKKPDYRAILKDRSGKQTEIRLSKAGDRLFGSSPERSEGVFEMHPDSTRFWNPSNFSGK